jgi:hypothetical protein
VKQNEIKSGNIGCENASYNCPHGSRFAMSTLV